MVHFLAMKHRSETMHNNFLNLKIPVTDKRTWTAEGSETIWEQYRGNCFKQLHRGKKRLDVKVANQKPSQKLIKRKP